MCVRAGACTHVCICMRTGTRTRVCECVRTCEKLDYLSEGKSE